MQLPLPARHVSVERHGSSTFQSNGPKHVFENKVEILRFVHLDSVRGSSYFGTRVKVAAFNLCSLATALTLCVGSASE
jgi:hypothetical protein